MGRHPGLRHGDLAPRSVAPAGLVLAGLVLLTACGGTDAGTGTPSGRPLSADEPSLQTPPFAQDEAPSDTPTGADPASVAANFDPDVQRFVWVLPPGVHGEGPWTMHAEVRHRGEIKFETDLPLVAETLPSGSRPEYTDGYEIIRLSGDERWTEQTAAIDAVIRALIEQHGRGDGEVTFFNRLSLRLDPEARQAYCTDGQTPDIRMYVEEAGREDLTPLDPGMAADAFSRIAVSEACGP